MMAKKVRNLNGLLSFMELHRSWWLYDDSVHDKIFPHNIYFSALVDEFHLHSHVFCVDLLGKTTEKCELIW